MTFLSVIIPTYHRNDLLTLCLEKLAPGIQTLASSNYEVIVTDDGDTQTAQSMLLLQYNWARWVKGPRKGPAANRNNGAKHAKSGWLVYLDDDCLPDPQWLESYKKAIEESSNIKVFEGKTICREGFKSPMEYAPSNTTGGSLISCNFCIDAEIHAKLGGFDEKFPYPHLEDNDYKDRIDALQLPIQFVENAVVNHPPRRLASGVKLGKYQESQWYYFQAKKGEKVSVSRILFSLLKLHLLLVYRQPLSLDSFKALWLIVEEWVVILANFQTWNKKYPVKNPN